MKRNWFHDSTLAEKRAYCTVVAESWLAIWKCLNFRPCYRFIADIQDAIMDGRIPVSK